MSRRLLTLIITTASFFITLVFAIYQGHTGPTYPVNGSSAIGTAFVKYKLPRSQDTGKDAVIKIESEDREVQGTLVYRRYPTNDEFKAVEMKREGKILTTSIPTQPPAGKLEYQIRVKKDGSQLLLPATPAIIRFKGSVPAYVLIPHIILIFLGLLFSVRSALKSFLKFDPMRDSKLALLFLFTGGLVLGPIVQKFAFDAFWTGYPFGHDVTDNKIVFAVLAWVLALLIMFKIEKAKKWAPIAALLVVFIVFGIPHSVRGSQLDWSKIPQPVIKDRNNGIK
jgi:hypothetical protein